MFVSRRHRAIAGVLALVVVVLAGCGANPPDRRTDVESFTDRIRAMPGVVAATPVRLVVHPQLGLLGAAGEALSIV